NRGRSFMDVSPFPRFAAPSGTYDHFWWTRGARRNARVAEIHRKRAAFRALQPPQSKRMAPAKSRAKDAPFRPESPRFFPATDGLRSCRQDFALVSFRGCPGLKAGLANQPLGLRWHRVARR